MAVALAQNKMGYSFRAPGSATLTRTADDYTDVTMNGAGLTDGETHMNHIHDGTGCGEDEYAGVRREPDRP